MVTCCTMVVARNRLLGCHAFMAVNTKTTFGLARNMILRSVLPNGIAPSTTSPLLSAPREAGGLASRFFVHTTAVHSSSGGVAAGESSLPPPEKWNLSVSLGEYIALGPRHRHRQQHHQPTGDWVAEAADLADSLGIDPPTSIEAQHRRVFHLYLPVYFWLKELLLVSRQQQGSISSDGGIPECSNHTSGRTHSPPLVVGISAPQGCGKSTLVSEMQRMLEKAGHSCVVVSIDDFYLTGAEQVSSC